MRATILLAALTAYQVHAAGLVSQFSDGQPQAPITTSESPTNIQTPITTPVNSPYSTFPLVSQISDHQPQAPETTSRLVNSAPTPIYASSSVGAQVSETPPEAPESSATSATASVLFTSGASTSSDQFVGTLTAMIGLYLLVVMML